MMDELEFRTRVYANPGDLEQEVLDAARANPAYQQILDESLAFEGSLAASIASTEISAGLKEKLLSIPDESSSEEDESTNAANTTVTPIRARKQSFYQYYAIAASLVLAVGVVFSLNFNAGPSSADIVFGEELLDHLHHDIAEIDDITGGETYAILDMDEVNFAMANAGTKLVSQNASQNFEVRSAKPCEIIPAFESAHLVLQGAEGAISVIVINNSPVDVQFTIRDERFDGVILPMEEGNIVLVGEKNEDLSQYASLFSESVEWAI